MGKKNGHPKFLSPCTYATQILGGLGLFDRGNYWDMAHLLQDVVNERLGFCECVPCVL